MHHATHDIEHLQRRLARLEQRSRNGRRLMALVAAVWLATTSLGARAEALMWTVFSAGTPARASEVNDNFALLRQWLEAKVGSVEDVDIRAPRAVLATGDVRAGEHVVADGELQSSRGIRTSGFVSATGDLTAGSVSALGDVLAGGQLRSAGRELRFDGGANGAGGSAIGRSPGAAGRDRLVLNAGQSFERTQIVGDLEVTGSLLFNRQNCVARTGNTTWVYCQDGEFVAGIDHDNNSDRVGGVYCCKF